MTRFVRDYLWPLVVLLTLQISFVDGSELGKRSKKASEPFYAFENSALRRLLVRSTSYESVTSSGLTSLMSSPRKESASDSSISTESPVGKIFASGVLPDRLVEFLTLNPFPFQVDKYSPFDPLNQEIWMNYFLMSRLTLWEVFALIEKLFEDVATVEGSSGWFFANKQEKIVDVIFATALFVYFKGNLGASVSKIFMDYNLVYCSAKIQNKHYNI